MENNVWIMVDEKQKLAIRKFMIHFSKKKLRSKLYRSIPKM
ncbi:hypothetical protein LEP1GSC127_3717 [Leptospira kirschneri str. 200801925]|nr:hypothetical protein LEP1GSC127_3717 [Leptospira kirschneri str. 200801925]